jgi:hypothetical protein
MGPAFKLAFLGLLTFAAAFALRHMFFGDVMPVSWDQEPVSNAALMMAYLLLSIENVAATVAVISLLGTLVFWVQRFVTKRSYQADV